LRNLLLYLLTKFIEHYYKITMRKIALCFMLLTTVFISIAQERETPKPNYRLASKFSPTNLQKIVHSTTIRPHWLKRGNKFWYQYKTSEGSNYYLVDADRRTRIKLFDNEKMAKWLTEATKDPYDAKDLPVFAFKFVKGETAIRFRVTSTEDISVKEDKKKDADKKDKKKPKTEKKIYHFEYRIGSNSLILIDNSKKEDTSKRWANIAPDSSVVVFSKRYNLYWMNKENYLKAVKDEKDSTIVEHQWTTDGIEHFGYGGNTRRSNNETKEKTKNDRKRINVVWNHDSKKFVFQKTDQRALKDLWLVNTTNSKRPTLETYKYQMPGEQEFTKTELLIFDISSKDITKVQLDTIKQQSLQVYRTPVKRSSFDDDFIPSLLLSKQNKIYYNTISRDRKKLDICVADLTTGEVKVLIEERFNTYIESRPLVLFNNETEMLHWAERDGWAHFYLYDRKGNLKNQITKGSYHVDDFVGLDERNRTLYFNANGVSKNQDPYYSHAYKISLNGTGLKNLTPGDYNTRISMADSNGFFINNYSRVNTIPKSELRNSAGNLVMKLEEADLSQLFATGYQFPEPFKMKADDGITNIYGVLYKPFDIDSTKSIH